MDIAARQKLASIIKQHRGSKSYRAYGKMLGVSGTTIQDWESSTSIPSRDNLAAIASAVGYTLQELLEVVNGRSLPNPTPLERLLRQVEALTTEEVSVVVQLGVRKLTEGAIAQAR